MRLLGIDYGSKRVGIALSDEAGVMAFPHSVLPNDERLLTLITQLVIDKNVQAIVVGHSLDRTGNTNEIHVAVEALMVDLTLALGVPIHLQPEHYTTKQALRDQGRNDKLDASAAALILNSYITQK